MSEIPEICFDLAKRIFAIEKRLGMAKTKKVAQSNQTNQTQQTMQSNDLDAPLCSDCGVAMTRTGACYSCSQCGAAGGCG